MKKPTSYLMKAIRDRKIKLKSKSNGKEKETNGGNQNDNEGFKMYTVRRRIRIR